MATEPQFTPKAPVNTSLRKTNVWNVYLHCTPKLIMGGRRKKIQASEKSNCTLKAHGSSPENLLGVPPKYPRQSTCFGLVLT